MTSYNLSIYDPVCSNCWNKHKKINKDKQILFLIANDLHWACSKRCFNTLKSMTKKKINENPKKLLRILIKMYIEIFEDIKA